jgi:hypothetical protein
MPRGLQILFLLLIWLSRFAKTAALRHLAVAYLLAGAFLPPHGAIWKIQPHIIAARWARLAVDDARHPWSLPGERSEHPLVSRMPKLRGHNASAMRADVAREGPFGSTRLLRPCNVDGKIRAAALLSPSVGGQRAVANRWSPIYSQDGPVLRKRVLLSGTSISQVMVLCINAGWQTMRRMLHFLFREILEWLGQPKPAPAAVEPL